MRLLKYPERILPVYSPTSIESVAVHTLSGHYDVEIGTALLPQVGARLDALLQGQLSTGRVRSFVITSPELEHLWAQPLLQGFAHQPAILHVPAGESQKRMATVERLAEQLAQLGADRDSLLVALGGGVLGDLTGFLAAIYMRGIRFAQVPTTILAQVDSSVGGKTGANLQAGKNLIGAFHQPVAVFADLETLRTLPSVELRAGLQEAVKSAIIQDAALFDLLDHEQVSILNGDAAVLGRVVTDSVRIKAAVVAADEREGGLRMILNFGHTLGHALEAATRYTQLLHGEAVAWGMLAAIDIAQRRGMLPGTEAQRMQALIRAYGPLQPFHVPPEDLVALTAKDKKHRGGVRSFILPVHIGEVTVVHDVTEAELLRAAQTICQQAHDLVASPTVPS